MTYLHILFKFKKNIAGGRRSD